MSRTNDPRSDNLSIGRFTAHFGQMAWPLPSCEDTEIDGVQRRLRGYDLGLSHDDHMIAAEVMYAYTALIFKPRAQRDAVIRELRRAAALDMERTNKRMGRP